MSLYPYATGDLLKSPNTYFYTAFHGKDFIKAWKEDRERVVRLCGKPAPPPSSSGVSFQVKPGQNISSALLLEWIFDKLDADWIDRLVKRFEVDKRWYRWYDDHLRVIGRDDPAAYGNLELYIRAAEIFEAGYVRFGKLPYLNVFLKSIDTLSALVDYLSDMQKARLAWLINRENTHILSLSKL